MTNREKLAAYRLEIVPLAKEDGGGFQALYPQLARTLVGYGETQAQAVEDLVASHELLLASLDESEVILPDPTPQPEWEEFSGRVTLRLSKSLHYRLDRLKDAEGVSLNSLITDVLQSGATALEAGLTFGVASKDPFLLVTAKADVPRSAPETTRAATVPYKVERGTPKVVREHRKRASE